MKGSPREQKGPAGSCVNTPQTYSDEDASTLPAPDTTSKPRSDGHRRLPIPVPQAPPAARLPSREAQSLPRGASGPGRNLLLSLAHSYLTYRGPHFTGSLWEMTRRGTQAPDGPGLSHDSASFLRPHFAPFSLNTCSAPCARHRPWC